MTESSNRKTESRDRRKGLRRPSRAEEANVKRTAGPSHTSEDSAALSRATVRRGQRMGRKRQRRAARDWPWHSGGQLQTRPSQMGGLVLCPPPHVSWHQMPVLTGLTPCQTAINESLFFMHYLVSGTLLQQHKRNETKALNTLGSIFESYQGLGRAWVKVSKEKHVKTRQVLAAGK